MQNTQYDNTPARQIRSARSPCSFLQKFQDSQCVCVCVCVLERVVIVLEWSPPTPTPQYLLFSCIFSSLNCMFNAFMYKGQAYKITAHTKQKNTYFIIIKQVIFAHPYTHKLSPFTLQPSCFINQKCVTKLERTVPGEHDTSADNAVYIHGYYTYHTLYTCTQLNTGIHNSALLGDTK